MHQEFCTIKWIMSITILLAHNKQTILRDVKLCYMVINLLINYICLLNWSTLLWKQFLWFELMLWVFKRHLFIGVPVNPLHVDSQCSLYMMLWSLWSHWVVHTHVLSSYLHVSIVWVTYWVKNIIQFNNSYHCENQRAFPNI